MARHLRLFLLAILVNTTALAQERTNTMLKRPLRFSAFGAPLVEVSSLQGQTMLSIGGIGAAVINRRFFFGGFGQGGSTTIVLSDNHQYQASLSQGGVVAGYLLKANRPVHLITNVRLGWASNTFRDVSTQQRFDQTSVAITPSVGVEMNVTHLLRVQLMGGYRVVTNSDLPQPVALLPITSNGLVGTLALSFGFL